MGERLKKKNFVIGFGGVSSEHDISIITAIQIYKRSRSEEYNLYLLYETKEGEWFIGDKLENFETYKNFNKKNLTRVSLLPEDKGLYKIKNNKYVKLFDIDFFINCFHGGMGEDGGLAALLENSGVISSASHHTALGIAMDKYLTKLACISLDVPVVDFFCVSKAEWTMSREKIVQAVLQFDFPVVVKPASQGSSIGVTLATTYAEFAEAMHLAFSYDNSVIVERALLNKREFNCCAFKRAGGEFVLEFDEPKTDKVVIGFNDKYLAGASSGKNLKGASKSFMVGSIGMQSQERREKPSLKGKLKTKIINASKLLYNSLNMNGVVRFDFMLDEDNSKMYLGEINAVPGSLGYYFFEDINLVDELYEASKIYYKARKKNVLDAPRIFN